MLISVNQMRNWLKDSAKTLREGGAAATADVYEEIGEQLDAEACRLADSDRESRGSKRSRSEAKMGDPCAACTHAYDNHACEKCIDFGDWSPCRQLAPIVERIRTGERERCARICDYRASLYPGGAAAKKEAQELGRRIRGEK